MTDDTFQPDVDGAPQRGETVSEVARGVGGMMTPPARPTVGAVWQEGTPGHWVIRLSGLPGAPPGEEVKLGRPGASSHSPSISDHSSPAGHVSRISVAWIESPAGDISGIGRIMMQRISAGDLGKPVDPSVLAAAANDNATWVADLSGAGAIGYEPTVAELSSGDTLVSWIGADGHAHGRLYGPVDANAASRMGDGADAPESAAVNAVLGDLGPVGAAPDGGRRLQVAELRPGAFAVMWLAIGDGDPALRGSLFVSDADTGHSDDRSGGWTAHPVADIRLPHGFAGQFAMVPGGEEGAGLSVTYSEPAGTTTVNVLDHHGRKILGQEQTDEGHHGELGPLGLVDLAALTRQDKAPAAPPAPGYEDIAGLRAPYGDSQAPTSHDAEGKPAQTALAVAASPGVSETAPMVHTVQDGFAVAWQAPGSADDSLQIKLTIYDGNGVPTGPEILVTDGADADVAPAISSLGDGVATAYVQADDGALVVEAYAGDGAQIGQEAVVDPGETGAIVEIALGSNSEDELAVVYVQQTSDAGEGASGYGSIMLQRYAVAAGGGWSRLVELGRDGAHDGVDHAAQLTTKENEPGDVQHAVGRAPAVAGVDDGELAIVWVECDGTLETIKGVVLDQDGGEVLQIDLTGLLEGAGIAKGNRPVLLDTGDGDFLVSWLQPDGDDGYVVMTALYTETAPGVWLPPEQAVRLKAFDSEPRDFAVAVSSDDDGLLLNVIWREDSNGHGGGDKVYSQRYDIDGHRLGKATKVSKDDIPTDDQQPASNSLAATGLLDGQIVVVYTEQGSDGDVDLAAHIIDTSAVEEVGSGDASSNASDLASSSTFSTGVDEETAINPLGNEAGAGQTVSRINDVSITTATPVDVGSGWVQLREDGWLTVTPDAGYTGRIAFDYTVAGAAGGMESLGRVVVDVEANEAPAAVALFNQVTTVAENAGTAADLKVADIAMADGALGTDGLSLTGLDAGMFKIVGSALYLKEGIELDFESKPTLSIEILASHADGFDEAASFTLNVESASETPVLDVTGDSFVFAPGHGDAGGAHDVIDLRSSGYASYQELVDSGALIQAGDDVVVMLNPGDPADLHQIILKGVELSALSDSDFRFS